MQRISVFLPYAESVLAVSNIMEVGRNTPGVAFSLLRTKHAPDAAVLLFSYHVVMCVEATSTP